MGRADVPPKQKGLAMGWSLNIGKIAGTAVRIHITFLIFLAWIFFASYADAGAEEAWSSLVFMVLLFTCVLAHEFGHIFTARAFGVPTPDVTLLPIGGVARLARIPEEPRQEFLIAIAGPAVNVVIGLALVLLAGAHLSIQALSSVESARNTLVDRLADVNLFLAAFNMIPAFPMDGGRVLRALLASRMGYTHATEVAAHIGQGMAFVLGLVGLLWSPLLIFIAIFVYLAASSEAHMVALRAMAHGVLVTQAMMTQFARLTREAYVDEAAQTLMRTSQSEFPVVDGEGRPVGVLARGDLVRAFKEHGPHARVADVMSANLPAVSQRSRLDEAFRLLQEASAPAVAVVDVDGRLVGLVTAETVGHMMMLRRSLPQGATFGPWSRTSGV
jgi:Zn-dependent protease/CBS domain-containing protein